MLVFSAAREKGYPVVLAGDWKRRVLARGKGGGGGFYGVVG